MRILSKAWAEAHDAVAVDLPDQARASYAREHAMGTGPFRLVEGGLRHFVLERAPDWWGRERWPFDVDRIEYRYMNDMDAEIADLVAGRADFLTYVPASRLPEIEHVPGIRVLTIPTLRVRALFMNQGASELASSDVRGRNPLRDRRVRQAVYQAIDVERAVRAAGLIDKPIGMLLPPGINGHDPELDRRLPYDPAAARALLAEAGYPDGFSVRLDTSDPVDDDPFFDTIKALLGEVGIRITLQHLSDPELNKRVQQHTTDFYLRGLGTGIYDSSEYLGNLYRTDGGRGVNGSGYSNPEVDALLDQIETEMTTYVRDALIEKVWRIVLDDVVHVPMYRVVQPWAMRDRLDLPADPRLHWDFRYARLKDAPAP